jgi:hypothetical protein
VISCKDEKGARVNKEIKVEPVRSETVLCDLGLSHVDTELEESGTSMHVMN